MTNPPHHCTCGHPWLGHIRWVFGGLLIWDCRGCECIIGERPGR
jgi:hypothetical protein